MTIFVSAQYVANPAPPPDALIQATDDKGNVWTIPEGSDNGDWLRFLEEGGTIEPAAVPVDKNITAVPDTLFGGKTIREALSGQ